ncbi:hypothetical protein DSO57_1004565 [Entomophthora muscae]|uniref:Uncharacterized protein n=1 Tax=Entomophthora muscae TaxID=34485 RepID=A0ACC2RZ77_9FUNG|nr:hypothetical protein DSO57_1004565 [Entomophthora muscae]
MLLRVALLLGWAAGEVNREASGDGKYLHDLYGLVDESSTSMDAFERLHRTPLGGAIEQLRRIGREVPAVRLPIPRRIRHVSDKAIRANLQNSLISVCSARVLAAEKCVCKERFSHFQIVENKIPESLAAIAVDTYAHQIIVSYRPTRTLKNAFTNLEFELVQYPGAPRGVLVHKGFLKYHLSLNSQVEDAVGALLNQTKYRAFDVQVTGYSLGAGISIVSAPTWVRFKRKYSYPNRFLFYSYSGPRVGNEPFAQYLANLNVPVMRYTNREDSVPHVPIRSMGYVHVGVEFHEHMVAPNMTKLMRCSQVYDEDPRCSLRPHAVISFDRHYFPFNHFIPLPTYC